VPLVVGVDSSTSATKVEVRDADNGRVVGEGRAPHPEAQPPRSEQPVSSWWEALRLASSRALQAGSDGRFSRPPSRSAIGAMAIGGQQHGMVVLDKTDRVLRAAKLWNDTESAADSDELIARLGGTKAWAEACGSVPVAAFTITKLAWLAREEPSVFTRLAKVMLPHDWLNLMCCGQATTDRGDASGTGYFSPVTNAWLPELLDLVDDARDWIPSLPRVLRPNEPAGVLSTRAAQDLGMSAGTTLGPGTGDNMAAALGIGLQPGETAISLGTSGTVFALSDTPTADPSGAVAGFADASGHYLPLVCTLNATKVTETFRKLLDVDHEELDRLVLSADPGAGGLVLVPYLDGERTPNRPHATGMLVGLRSGASRQQLARAAVEGVICGLLDGFDALGAAGVGTAGRLVLIGGGAKSAAYRQVLADTVGREVTVVSDEELVARGAAIQASAVLNGTNPLEVAVSWEPPHSVIVEPSRRCDPVAVREAYAAARG
jgi:xylulokinase